MQAYLDLILEDEHWDTDTVSRALESVQTNCFRRQAENPLNVSERLRSDARLQIVFAVNVEFEDPDLQRTIFSLLRETTIMTLGRRYGRPAA